MSGGGGGGTPVYLFLHLSTFDYFCLHLITFAYTGRYLTTLYTFWVHVVTLWVEVFIFFTSAHNVWRCR